MRKKIDLDPNWSWGVFGDGGSPVIILQSSPPERRGDKPMWLCMWKERKPYKWMHDWVDKPTIKAWMLQTYTATSSDCRGVIRTVFKLSEEKGDFVAR